MCVGGRILTFLSKIDLLAVVGHAGEALGRESP